MQSLLFPSIMDRYIQITKIHLSPRRNKLRRNVILTHTGILTMRVLVEMDRAQNVVTRARDDNVVEGSKF